jgi:hypothetical protein
MACSKILSGDLPELTEEIIQYFLHDYKTLYSCILVNRLWCRLAIPLLWDDPFSFPHLAKNYHFIEVYLYKLNDDDKIKLNEYGINSSSFPSSALFNYSRFIKHFNIYSIYRSINIWKTDKKVKEENFTVLIIELLLKMFIDSGASLHTFVGYAYFHCFSKHELITQNPNFVCNIKNLKINPKLDTDYLEFLSSNCSSISFLDIHSSFDNNNMKYFSQIINSQRDLRIIKFNYSRFKDFPLSPLLKNSNCSNTLNTIIFYRIRFKGLVNTNFTEIFEQLNVLKSIHVLNCYSIDSGFIQHFVNVTKSIELKTLFLHEPLQFDLLQLLLQKFGYCLENIGFGLFSLSGQEQDLIINYCTKIKVLELVGRSCQAALNFTDLIQNLNHLSISNAYNIELGSNLLLNLGQILPVKLDYLCMDLKIKTEDFEIFLMNSQNTFIEKLLIRNRELKGHEIILPYIKEYIMKKKNVKYLAVEGYTSGITRDSLKNDEKELKEFKLHNIIVSDYSELTIKSYSFINESLTI